MPELPEVETVTNQIRPFLLGKKFISVTFSDKDLRYATDKAKFNILLQSEIISVARRAKYIQIFSANNHVLILHLGMSGRVLVQDVNTQTLKHDHITARLSSGLNFVFNDPRRFGMFDVLTKAELNDSRYFKDLGIESLDEKFDGKFLHELCRKSHSNIKALIMNQNNLVGVGNIYALESLFHSRIHPCEKASNLSRKQCDILSKNIKKILLEAITKGGSSIRDYKQVDGSSAYFQHEFFVYGKEGKNCKICETKIERIVQNNRSSFFCPNCQNI